MTDKLLLKPAKAGYAVATPQGAALRVALDGGAGRYRADIEGGTSIVDVTFQCDEAKYQYLYAFFRNRAGHGSEPFLIDLLLEGAPITEYTAYFIPGSLHDGNVSGTVRYVSAQIEAYPSEEDEDFDSSLVDIWEASEGDPGAYLNGFAAIIAAWPDA